MNELPYSFNKFCFRDNWRHSSRMLNINKSYISPLFNKLEVPSSSVDKCFARNYLPILRMITWAFYRTQRNVLLIQFLFSLNTRINACRIPDCQKLSSVVPANKNPGEIQYPSTIGLLRIYLLLGIVRVTLITSRLVKDLPRSFFIQIINMDRASLGQQLKC